MTRQKCGYESLEQPTGHGRLRIPRSFQDAIGQGTRLYHCIHGSSLLGAVYNSDMLCLKIYRIIKSRANSRQVNQMYKNTEERGFSPWKRDYRKEMRALYKATSNMKKIRMENCSLSLVK